MPHVTPYVQVLGHAVSYPHRLIVLDEDGQHHLWFGDRLQRPLETIPGDLAAWLQTQPGFVAAQSTAWVAIADLPVVGSPAAAPRPHPGGDD